MSDELDRKPITPLSCLRLQAQGVKAAQAKAQGHHLCTPIDLLLQTNECFCRGLVLEYTKAMMVPTATPWLIGD